MAGNCQLLTIRIPGYGICDPPQRHLLFVCGEFEAIVNAILNWYLRVVFIVVRIVGTESARLLLTQVFLSMGNASQGVGISLKASHSTSGERGAREIIGGRAGF